MCVFFRACHCTIAAGSGPGKVEKHIYIFIIGDSSETMRGFYPVLPLNGEICSGILMLDECGVAQGMYRLSAGMRMQLSLFSIYIPTIDHCYFYE
jgi:hypothetical protein